MKSQSPKQHGDAAPPGWVAMAVSVLGWSLTGVLGWSLFDARPLAGESGVSYWEAWTAATAAGTKLALAMVPLGLAAGWLWHRSRWGLALRRLLDEQPAKAAAVLVSGAISWVALSYVVYGALTLYRGVFASELVHKLALSISVPAAALVLGLLGYLLAGPVESLFGRLKAGWQIFAVSGLATAGLITGWTVGLIELGKVVWQAMTPWIYVPFLLLALCSVVGAMAAGYRRARQVAMATGLVALVSSGIFLLGEPSEDLRLALVYRKTGAGLITELTSPDEVHRFAAAEANEGQSAVCFPGVDPPELGDVGRAGGDAPNIVWLTIDAIRWDHTTMAGYERDTTPNMARHAERAAVFEHARTPASSTRQTMRALFTGVYPSMIDPPAASIFAMALGDEQLTVAEFLRAAGYDTTAFSSDGYIFSQDHGAMQGFSVVDEEPFVLKDTEGYSAPYIVDNIIDQLDAAGGPQFIWSHFMEPHDPYLVGPDPVDFGDEEIDRYDAAIHFVDSQIDRLLEFVAEHQDDRPTYVIITADHGEAWGEHGQMRHGATIHGMETHVPLIFWGPDVVADSYDQPVGVIDLYPTLFELAGLEVPTGGCGTSLADVLRSDDQPEDRPVFLEQIPDRSRTHFSVGFIRNNDKVVLHPVADAISLFDLSEDPDEKNNLAREQPERLQEHLDALRDYWIERGIDPADYGLDER